MLPCSASGFIIPHPYNRRLDRGVAMTPLPIEQALPALRQALHQRDEAVLEAPPGAGKTTRVPLALLDESWLASTARSAPGPASRWSPKAFSPVVCRTTQAWKASVW